MMAFNPDPTKQAIEILFSCKRDMVDHPELIFNGAPVSRRTDHKHLGLILQSNLSFEKHINEKIIIAKKNIGIIRHLNKFLPFKTLNQMYKTLVRSHFDYCDIIYHIPSNYNLPPLGISLHSLMDKVEKIQYQAALAITGTWQGSSRIKLYEELGWETLSDRRMCNRLLQLHKIIVGVTPIFLRENLPPIRRNVITLPNVFQEFQCRTNRYFYSFFPNATSTWNKIISNFEHLPTFDEMKIT